MNNYATLAEYKSYVTSRGQTATTDTTDDAVIDSLLESASRYIDSETGRVFYPYIQARYFDVPQSRELLLDEDLLEVITLTNGDSTTMSASEYDFVPKNIYPAYGLKIKDISSYMWQSNAQGSLENAVSVLAIWGYRQKYNVGAWKAGGTLGAAIATTSATSATMSAGHTLLTGQTWRIDNEILTGSVSSNTLTIERAINGSTATAHDNGTTVYYWQPEAGAKNAVLEIANSAYHRRFGRSTSDSVTVTAAGVVISPRDVPAQARAFIYSHRSIV
jgi:hypothetical protein